MSRPDSTAPFHAKAALLLGRLALGSPGPLILVWLLGTIGFGWLAAANTFDYDLREMLAGRGEVFDRYEECVRLFGPDDEIILAWPCDDLDLQAVRRSLAVRRAVQEVPGVAQVVDLSRVLQVEDEGQLDWLAERPRLFERRLADLRASGLLGRLLRSRDGKALAAYVRSEDLSALGKHALVKAVRQALAGTPAGEGIHLGGYPVFGERYVSLMMEGNTTFIALSVGATLLVSLALFRSFWLTAAAVMTVVFPAIWTQGLYACLGYRISLFSSLLTPMMLFVGLSLTIHFVARFRHALGRAAPSDPDRHDRALREAIGGALPPSLLCALTTVIGFASQILSGMEGVRAFGILSSMGCALAFLAVFLLLPALLHLGPTIDTRPTRGIIRPAWERVFGRWTARYAPPSAWAMPLAWIILLACIPGMARLQFGSDPLTALPAQDPVVVAHAFWREHFAGSGRQISMVCRPQDGGPVENAQGDHPPTREEGAHPARGDGFDRLEPFLELDRLAAAIASDPQVVSVVSPTDLVRDITTELSGGRESLPDRDAGVGRAFRLAAARSPALLSGLTNPPYFDRARLVVNLRQADAPIVVATARRLERLAGDSTRRGITASATGRMLLAAVIENDALHMELTSFLGAVSWIILIFALAFRNGMSVWVAVVVNLLPILFTTSMMGLLGQPLNPVTLMVPCIGIGVVVDDTIHLIHEMAREAARGHGPRRARANVMLRLGWALVSTSGILIVGMTVLVSSSFAPIRQFGIYGGLTLAVGMLTDLCLTPAFLQRNTKSC